MDKAVVGYMAYRQAAAPAVAETIGRLYAELLEIEKSSGVEASEQYLNRYLESKQMSYDEYIDDVIGNKGAFKLFFAAMAKLFGHK